MRTYAQTNLQLFDELRREGYSDRDVSRVRDAYELATHLFTGLVLPAGKLFIDHVVGTAAILASLRAPVEVVAAGLVHAAYFSGDFGSVRTGVSRAKREEIRNALGNRVEEIAAAYEAMDWDSKSIPALRDGVEKLDGVGRSALLIQLANEIEHRLDFADLYAGRGDWLRQYAERYLPMMLDMARGLGFSALAAELAQGFQDAISGEIAIEARSGTDRPHSYRIAPRSYRKRRWIDVTQRCGRGISRLRVAVGLRTRVRRLVHRFAH